MQIKTIQEANNLKIPRTYDLKPAQAVQITQMAKGADLIEVLYFVYRLGFLNANRAEKARQRKKEKRQTDKEGSI